MVYPGTQSLEAGPHGRPTARRDRGGTRQSGMNNPNSDLLLLNRIGVPIVREKSSEMASGPGDQAEARILDQPETRESRSFPKLALLGQALLMRRVGSCVIRAHHQHPRQQYGASP